MTLLMNSFSIYVEKDNLGATKFFTLSGSLYIYSHFLIYTYLTKYFWN